MSHFFKFLPILFIFSISTGDACKAQEGPGHDNVYVDPGGVLRWKGSDEEIKGFGVNYTVPFAHAWRSARKLGVDPLEAIDRDVYHFARLGFDLYRVHVWDTEISDTLGNLLFNEHLHAFDYLLYKLGERDINYVLTPIAFWGNGWPEPDEPTPGFSARYGKGDCLTDEGAIRAQENYLTQFLDHINPYTGIACKDDPRLIAVEVSNEPHHREEPETVTAFIRRMVDAIRGSGYSKPVFYNVSHSVHLAKNYFAAGIQGGTFQWYPTGLGYQRELPFNVLPNVDDYRIPFDDVIRNAGGAKFVYEFDAADVGRAYPYPAMARSFREAGIQLATHFSYDPMYLAYANTEYNTHHMNLAYTPQKALGLMICSEIFHQIPMYSDFGSYPENTEFGDFSISYEKDLALLNGGDQYYYTNDTDISPRDQGALVHIAGCGSSPVVSYDGTGAYFLDKVGDGIWRLEVMPDAAVIRNPYERNSLDKAVARVQWNERAMEIKLANLGNDFSLEPFNEGNDFQPEPANGAFFIRPGVYLLRRAGSEEMVDAKDKLGRIRLGEFQAPADEVDRPYLVHQAAEVAPAGQPLTIRAKILSPEKETRARILIDRFRGGAVEMEHVGGFEYEATIKAEKVEKGFFRYYIVIGDRGDAVTFPGGNEGMPWRWDYHDRNPYVVRVIGDEQPVYLFRAQQDHAAISATRWLWSSRLVPLDDYGRSEWQVNVEELHRPDPENLNGPGIRDYTLRMYANEKVDAVRLGLAGMEKLIVRARSLNDKPVVLQVGLTTSGGATFGAQLALRPEMAEYVIPLDDLEKVRTVTMPRPYPTFLPYYFTNEREETLDIRKIEAVQVSLGPGLPEEAREEKHGFAIESVRLSPAP